MLTSRTPAPPSATRAVVDLIATLLREQAETVALLRYLDREEAPLTLAALHRQQLTLTTQLAAARRVLPWAHRVVLA
jgi:hypothetical protein